MFGNQAPRASFGVGTSTSGTHFGAPATTQSGFGTSDNPGVFGTPQQSTSFGTASTPFDATTSTAGSLFGGQTGSPSGGLFGQQNQPAYGFTQTTTGFDNTGATSLYDQTQQLQPTGGGGFAENTDIVTDTDTMTRNGDSTNIEESIEVLSAMMCQISVQNITSTESSHGNEVNSEELLRNCQEHAWHEVSRLLKHSTHYSKDILTKAILISKSDNQWDIIGQILMHDVCFDNDVIALVLNEAVLQNQHEFIAYLGSIYGKSNVLSQALLYCEEKCNWEMSMTILNISIDIHVSVLNKVLISASHNRQWLIVHKILQRKVEFSDLALERVLDCATLNDKLDLVEDIAIRYSHIISDKILLQATIHQRWKFIFILLKSQKEFRNETLKHVFSEAFVNLDTDIMQYFFTQNYSEELLHFKTLIMAFGRICGNEQELSKKVAFLLEEKVKIILTHFKMNTSNSLGSIWSHYLDGNIQVAEICKHSVMGYCRLERRGCPCLHATENFHWQISFTGNYWINLTKQQSQCIEEAFCNPCIDNCYPFSSNSQLSSLSMQDKGIMDLLGHENWVVDFKYNIISNYLAQCNTNDIKHRNHVFIRRLAVTDSVANQYQWYFKENNDWVMYGNRGAMGESANITSDALEQFYSKILEVSSDLRFYNFFTKTHSYILDFHNMEQINNTTGMKRLVKRRPKKHLFLPLCSHNEIIKSDSIFLVNVEIPAGEYKEMFDNLKYAINSVSINGSHIESVVKVNNKFLERAHKIRLEMMEKQYAGVCKIYINKVLHGTKKEFVEKIILENFDWRLYGKSNGKVFGQGTYFTSDPKIALSYAKPDCEGKKYLIIASMIVGFIIVGNKNMEKPPINPVSNLPYDTSVNNLTAPSIFVKYNKQEYCPEYVIIIKKTV